MCDEKKARRAFQMMVRPEMLNGAGTLHGGEYAKILDELSGATADWYYPHQFVTGAIHALHFEGKASVRDLLRAEGQVIATGRRTVLVETTLYRRTRYTDQEERIAHGFYTMICVDPIVEEKPIPTFVTEDPDDAARTKAIRAAIEAFRNID